MTDSIPVHAEPGDPLVLEIRHHGVVVMRVPVRVAGPGPVSVHRVQAHVAYDNASGVGLRTVAVELRSTVEDIAAWVAGDGTDAQRLALADGIREAWQGRPQPGELRDASDAAGARAVQSLNSLNGWLSEAGVARPDPDRWAAAEEQARAEIRARSLAPRFDDGQPQPTGRRRDRVVPADDVPVSAEDVAGAAARIADLEYQFALVLRAIEHEINECLLVDGRQLADPHANGRSGRRLVDHGITALLDDPAALADLTRSISRLEPPPRRRPGPAAEDHA